MKTVLVTTTINVPHALKWYRACSLNTPFLVVLDKKTPNEAANFCAYDIGDNACVYFDAQKKWKCSELIGWNSIQRRNIGFLEALKIGADVIVSVDDDNLPLDFIYFSHYALMSRSFSGLRAKATTGLFDIGDFLVPRSKQRGIPHYNKPGVEFDSVIDAKLGVMQGLCIGAPDVNAATRFVNDAVVHQVSEVARAGFVVHSDSDTIWNSQNTAIVRALIPAWGMVPHVGRMDDIYASIICHRVMREHGYHVHYGQPMVYQQRNPHSLVKDMRGEIDGYETVEPLAAMLDHATLPGKTVIDDTRRIWELIAASRILPEKSIVAMMAYIDDCETVL